MQLQRIKGSLYWPRRGAAQRGARQITAAAAAKFRVLRGKVAASLSTTHARTRLRERPRNYRAGLCVQFTCATETPLTFDFVRVARTSLDCRVVTRRLSSRELKSAASRGASGSDYYRDGKRESRPTNVGTLRWTERSNI